MEIPAWVYFSVWAIIGSVFLHLGFNALDKTGLSLSVHPLVMSFFKHSLTISVCHSSSYALIFRQHVRLTAHERYSWVTFGTVLCLVYRPYLNITFLWGCGIFLFIYYLTEVTTSLPGLTAFVTKYSAVLTCSFISSAIYAWFFPIFTLINFVFIYGKFDQKPEQRICLGIHMAVETSLFLVSAENMDFFPILVLLISFITSAYWAGLSRLEPYTRVSRNPLLTAQDFQKLLNDEELLEHEGIQEMLLGELYQALLADEEVLADERVRALAADERFWHLIPAVARPDKDYEELLRLAVKLKENFVVSKDKMMGKWLEFAIGMVATVLFQNFFRLTSFDHVVAFLYLVVAWLANIALVGGGGTGDLGILNFLLGNVIVGCTMNQFGLRVTTWIAYGVSVVLFGLRLKLESLRFVNREAEQTKVVLW